MPPVTGTAPVRTGSSTIVAVPAMILVDLWCPVAYPLHVLYGHIMPMVVLGLVGAVVGWRYLGMH